MVNQEVILMHNTLAVRFWPRSRDSLLIQLILAVAGTMLLALSAKVQVAFWPVPMTMQTFVVLVLGLAYGPRLGAATGALYLLEGALGLPVFAKGVGLAYLAGPTGGYLFGFLAAMTVMGWLARRGWDRSVLTMLGAMLIGELLIFLPGVAWLAVAIGASKAVTLGLMPFLPAEICKMALAATTLPLAWTYLNR
jgi:biotin transport system substrate-specific component